MVVGVVVVAVVVVRDDVGGTGLRRTDAAAIFEQLAVGDPAIAAETAHQFPAQPQRLWTVDELGAVLGKGTAAKNNGKDLTGWPAVDAALFGDKGTIAAAYKNGGK